MVVRHLSNLRAFLWRYLLRLFLLGLDLVDPVLEGVGDPRGEVPERDAEEQALGRNSIDIFGTSPNLCPIVIVFGVLRHV